MGAAIVVVGKIEIAGDARRLCVLSMVTSPVMKEASCGTDGCKVLGLRGGSERAQENRWVIDTLRPIACFNL